WGGLNKPPMEVAAGLVELVGSEVFSPAVKKGEGVLFETDSLADLESIPRGEETNLPTIPKSIQPDSHFGTDEEESREEGIEKRRFSDAGVPGKPAISGPVEAVEAEEGSEGFITPDSPLASTGTTHFPDGERQALLPAIPFVNEGRGGVDSRSRPGGGSALFTGGMPGLPFADAENLDRLARVFTERERLPKDPVSINTEDFKYFSYLLKVKDQIRYLWKYPAAAAQSGLEGDLLVRFTIRRNGRLSKVSVISSSGHDLLDEEAVRAIRKGTPFAPLPDAWQESHITITGHFVYYNRLTYIR
ncbi:MAG: energy transducer TonB, partial [Nitrospiria bacterium]